MEQEKLELKNRSQQVNQKKTPVLLGVLEVWGWGLYIDFRIEIEKGK